MATVSNPYTFTITANKTVSASISASAPVVLLEGIELCLGNAIFNTPSGISKIAFRNHDTKEIFDVLLVTPDQKYEIGTDVYYHYDEEEWYEWATSTCRSPYNTNKNRYILTSGDSYTETTSLIADIVYGPAIELLTATGDVREYIN